MRFKRVYIEILNTCNLQCSFCIQHQRPSKKVSLAAFQHIIKEIKPYTKYVYLHVLGEPLLHPDLPKFIKVCEAEGMFVNLTTNGTLLSSCITELKDCKIRQLNISLHSYSQHHQEQYVKNIVESVQQLTNTSYISYRLWNLQQGKLDQESQAMMHSLLQLYQIEELVHLGVGSSIVINDHTFLNFDEVFEWPSLGHAFIAKNGACRGFLDMCGILVDGSVIPCCLDAQGDVTFGNIYQSSFSSILESDRAKTFYQGIKAKELAEELCQKCGYRTRFD